MKRRTFHIYGLCDPHTETPRVIDYVEANCLPREIPTLLERCGWDNLNKRHFPGGWWLAEVLAQGLQAGFIYLGWRDTRQGAARFVDECEGRLRRDGALLTRRRLPDDVIFQIPAGKLWITPLYPPYRNPSSDCSAALRLAQGIVSDGPFEIVDIVVNPGGAAPRVRHTRTGISALIASADLWPFCRQRLLCLPDTAPLHYRPKRLHDLRTVPSPLHEVAATYGEVVCGAGRMWRLIVSNGHKKPQPTQCITASIEAFETWLEHHECAVLDQHPNTAAPRLWAGEDAQGDPISIWWLESEVICGIRLARPGKAWRVPVSDVADMPQPFRQTTCPGCKSALLVPAIQMNGVDLTADRLAWWLTWWVPDAHPWGTEVVTMWNDGHRWDCPFAVPARSGVRQECPACHAAIDMTFPPDISATIAPDEGSLQQGALETSGLDDDPGNITLVHAPGCPFDQDNEEAEIFKGMQWARI